MHRTIHEKGITVKPTEQSAQKPSQRPGLLRGLLHGRGIGASAAALAVTFALTGLLALTTVPALAYETHVLSTSFNGSGSTALSDPQGVAIDQSTGEVYVIDSANNRVEIFSASGAFISAFGANVGGPGINTCTAGCVAGTAGSGNGQFTEPTQVAVDNSTGIPGDVYVFDQGNERIEVFNAKGEYQSQVTKADLVATNPPGGAGPLVGIAIDGDGNLWIYGTKKGEGVQAGIMYEFPPGGPSPGRFSFTTNYGTSPGLAVDSSGDLFVIRGIPLVEKFTGSGNDVGTVTQEGPNPTGLAVDSASGDLYVDRGNTVEHYAFSGPAEVSEQGSAACTFAPDSETGCPATDVFGSESGRPALSAGAGVAVEPMSSDVYVADAANNRVDIFVPATLPDTTTGAPTAVTKTTALLHGTVNPDGIEVTSCEFEWGTEPGVYPHTAACSPAPGSGNAPIAVSAELTTLTANTTYHYRLAATNATGDTTNKDGREESFTTTPAVDALSTGPAQDITAHAAKLTGSLSPDGTDAHYYFQYGTEATYGSTSPELPGTDAGTGGPKCKPPGGAECSAVSAETTLEGLPQSTTYHYRLVAVNSFGTTYGQDATFETHGPLVIDSEFASEVTDTSATLDAQINPRGIQTSAYLQYGTVSCTASPASCTDVPLAPGADIGSSEAEQTLSQHIQGLSPDTVYYYRVVATNELTPPGGTDGPDQTFTTQRAGSTGESVLPDGREWELVSPPDKHGASILPIFPPAPGIQAAAGGGAMAYMTTDPTEAEPVGNAGFAQVLSTRGPAGWSSRDLSAPHAEGVANSESVEEYRVLSSDLSLSVVQPLGDFNPSLSEEASEQTGYLRTDYLNGEPSDFCTSSCYRPLVTGVPGFENVLEGTVFGGNPVNGRQCPPEVLCGPQVLAATPDLSHIVLYSQAALIPGGGEFYEWSSGQLQPVPGVGQPPHFGNGVFVVPTVVRNAISADGSRVYFDGGVRVDIGTPEARTVPVPGGSFETASADGSRAFVLGGGELSEFELESEASVPIAAGVLGVIGASEDGSSVYFVSDAKLAPGAVEGTCVETSSGGTEAQPPGSTCNLYVYRGGETGLIAVLSGEDSPDWGDGLSELINMTARVSPDGGWLAFMSDRSLTGYDNRDAVSGVPDEEVYLYDASTGKVVCASCNPTGARPHGTEIGDLEFQGGGLVGGEGLWGGRNAARWLAANVPGWTSPYHQSRYLSDGGRLFFDSSDALVPQDTNNTEDVYEYEPPGGEAGAPANDTCTIGSATYGPRSQGCVLLISSGTSPEQSAFLDASDTGSDVFFLTAAKLSALDVDSALDVYDAHVCSVSSPCPPPPPPPLPACEGDACQSPVAAPEDPTPGSLTFQGPGNPTVQPTITVPKKATKKRTIRCRKGKQFNGGRCVKQKAKKHKAKQANSERRAKS